jgi:hypothetical protein
MKKLLQYIILAAGMLFCTVMMVIDLCSKSSINSAEDVIVLIGLSLFLILMDAIIFAFVYITKEADVHV